MRTLALCLVGTLLWVATAAHAAAPDWNAVAGEDTLEIVTHDPDGDVRETTVWMGVVDDVGYVRTTDSRWLANIGRDPNVVVRVAGAEYELRAEQISDTALRARVDEVFRVKYGFVDRVLGWFGNNGGKQCLALLPRAP